MLTEASTALETALTPASSTTGGAFDKASLFNEEMSCSEMSSDPNLNAMIDRDRILERI